MWERYEEELLCDFAEFYHIYDLEAFPARYIATLAVGLPERSRIVMAVSGTKMPTETAILTLIFDVANWIKWAQTKDAIKGRNRPKSLYESIMQTGTKEKIESFASGEDFERQRAAILEGIDDGE